MALSDNWKFRSGPNPSERLGYFSLIRRLFRHWLLIGADPTLHTVRFSELTFSCTDEPRQIRINSRLSEAPDQLLDRFHLLVSVPRSAYKERKEPQTCRSLPSRCRARRARSTCDLAAYASLRAPGADPIGSRMFRLKR